VTRTERWIAIAVAVAGLGIAWWSFEATPTPPRLEDVASISWSLTPRACIDERFQTTDKDSIARIIDAYGRMGGGWKTSRYLALTRGWFTAPSFPNTALFRDKNGNSLHVLWFADELVGARTFQGGRASDAYRQPTPELLAALRGAKREPLKRC
jgi:hypothetical protein